MALAQVVQSLAQAAVGGPWTQRAVVERAAVVVGLTPEALTRDLPHAPLRKALRGLVRRHRTPVPVEEAEAWLWTRLLARPQPWVRYRLVAPPLVGEGLRTGPFEVPPIGDACELATHLGLTPSELAWLADVRGRAVQHPHAAARHYRHRWVPKRNGTGHRLLEIPKPRLKQAQRRMLDQVVSTIPAHPAAHGFLPGGSVIRHAAGHVGRHTVVTLDLQSWFWHVGFERVRGLFRCAGLPREVSMALAGLATASTPHAVIAAHPDAPALPVHRRFDPMLLRQTHLPQGAPTSPGLANAVAWGLDVRLSALAAAAGATYSRYADDLAFSGDAGFGRGARRLVGWVGEIVREEGFRLHPHKIRIQRRGQAQRVCGLIVNEHVAVSRRERDRLEAMLRNAARDGGARLRAEGHDDPYATLAGRVGWVAQVNPRHGARLRALLPLPGTLGAALPP